VPGAGGAALDAVRHPLTTFRISLIAAEPITLSVTVTESGEAPDARYLGVEFTIENAQLERATLGSATLRR